MGKKEDEAKKKQLEQKLLSLEELVVPYVDGNYVITRACDAAARMQLSDQSPAPMGLSGRTVGKGATNLRPCLSRVQYVCEALIMFCSVTFTDLAQSREYQAHAEEQRGRE